MTARTRNKNRYEKKRPRSKTRQNGEKPNFKLFVILKSPEFLKGPILTAIGNGVTLFVTRWWQALTISYLTDSFEIIIMPKEMFFLARLWQINSKAVLNFRVKKKGDLRIQRCHQRVMIKQKISFPLALAVS